MHVCVGIHIQIYMDYVSVMQIYICVHVSAVHTHTQTHRHIHTYIHVYHTVHVKNTTFGEGVS
jgi:hypothetical protein